MSVLLKLLVRDEGNSVYKYQQTLKKQRVYCQVFIFVHVYVNKPLYKNLKTTLHYGLYVKASQ